MVADESMSHGEHRDEVAMRPCSESLVTRTPILRRLGQLEAAPLITSASPHTHHVAQSWVSCSHALTLDVASRCSSISTPALLAYSAALTLLVGPHEELVVARLSCRDDGSGSVELRLEPAQTVHLGDKVSLSHPVLVTPRIHVHPVDDFVPEQSSMRVPGSLEQSCQQGAGRLSGFQRQSNRRPSHPRVAGLWISLSDLPLSPSRDVSSASQTPALRQTLIERVSTSSFHAAARSPKQHSLSTTPWVSKVTPSSLRCTSACSTAAAGHVPPQLSEAPDEACQDTASALDLTSKLPLHMKDSPDHVDSGADEQSELCGTECAGKAAPIAAHPVGLLCRSLHNVVSPPMSSLDGDEGGCSGPLNGGTAIATLDSVDGAITDNGNISEMEPGGVSAAPSVTDHLADAAEQRDSADSEGGQQFAGSFAQLGASAAATAVAEDSDCGCEEYCDGIDRASNDLEGDISGVPGPEVATFDGETEGDTAQGLHEAHTFAAPRWDDAPCVADEDECSFSGAGHPHSSPLLQVSQQVTTSTCPVPGFTAGVCGTNDLEGSMHAVHDKDGTRADAATATLERCYGQASCMPEGEHQESIDIDFEMSPYGLLSATSTHTPPISAHPSPHTHAGTLSIARAAGNYSSLRRAVPCALELEEVPEGSAPPSITALAHIRAGSTPAASQHGRPGIAGATRPPTDSLAPLPPLSPLVGPSTSAAAVPATVPSMGGVAGPPGSALVPPGLPPLMPVAPASAVHVLVSPSATAPPQPTESVQTQPTALSASSTGSVRRGHAHGVAAEGPHATAQLVAVASSPTAQDPPDVPITSTSGASSLFSLLDQHLLDRILLHVSATNSLNPAATVCRRFRNAARRVAGSATLLPSSNCTPPVDPATGALDLRPLQQFPGLHTLRLPKFDRMRKIEILPVELFRLRMLTQLTYLDIQCAAYVPTFQPLRLLPALRHLSCAGASLHPPPDIPALPNCEVMLYANRGLSAANRRNVISALPPLSGLRVPSKAPAALLQQIGTAPSMRNLTYLRLGSCQSPALDPLSSLTRLVRLHLHVVNGHVTPLTTLSMLTYLHLHGHVDDLAVALGSFRRLQKLSLIKCKRLRADEVRAVGTLAALTSLELPCSKASFPPRDIRPLARLKNLQHLSLAMPEAGISPLTRLTALTFLRLKHRAADDDRPPAASRLVLTASLFSMHLAVSACTPAVRALGGGGAPQVGAGSGGSGSAGAAAPAPILSDVMGSVMHSASHAAISTAVTLAGAAAFPLAAYATRRAWAAVTQTLFPPVLDAGCLSDLCLMTQLEWLEVKSSTMPTPEEWSAALRPLTRLRRLDVRNTAFRDPAALQNMPHLRVVLISGCVGLPGSDRVLQDAAALREDVEIRR